jgi:hypothetical protein
MPLVGVAYGSLLCRSENSGCWPYWRDVEDHCEALRRVLEGGRGNL